MFWIFNSQFNGIKAYCRNVQKYGFCYKATYQKSCDFHKIKISGCKFHMPPGPVIKL